MRRVRLCSGILIVILIASILMLLLLRSYNQELNTKIDEAIELWHGNMKEETLEKVDEITKLWAKYSVRMSFMVQADKMEHISASVARLKPLLECGSDEFYSECESIRFSTNLIYDNHFPQLHSIF